VPTLRANASKSATFTVPDAAFARALTRIKKMTKSERIKSLKDAGILTPGGNYTKPYRAIPDRRVA
jgi:hypothetical protein